MMDEDEELDLLLVDEDECFKYYEGPVEINGKRYTFRFTENKLDPETKVPKKIQRAIFRGFAEQST